MECGLELEWSAVFREPEHGPADLFEHASKRRLWAFANTLWRVLVPPMLWSRLHLFHPVRPGRLIAFAVLALLLNIVVISAVAPYLIDASLFSRIRGFIMWSAASKQTPASLADHLRWYRVLFTLHADHAFGLSGITTGRSMWPLHTSLSMMLMPPAFVCLSRSLRQARVKPVHLVRVFLYSMPAIPAFLLVWKLPAWSALPLGNSVEAWLAGMPWALPMPPGVFASLLLMTLWWWCACSMYLKIRWGWLAAGLLAIVSFLAALLLMLLLAPNAMAQTISRNT